MIKVDSGKVKEAYTRLCEIHNLIGGKIKFDRDSKIGYTCSDFKNLGNSFGIELSMQNDKPATAKQIQRLNPQIRIVTEKDLIKIKGKGTYGIPTAKVVEQVYQSIANIKK